MAANNNAPANEQEILPEGMTDAEVGAAVDFTNREIFDAAWSKEEPGALDPTGNRSLEQMGDGLEGQVEDDEESDQADEEGEDGEDAQGKEGKEAKEGEDGEGDEGDDEGEDQGEGEGEDGEPAGQEAAPPPAEPGRVPSGRLREQTERATRAEESLRALQAEREAERTQTRKDMDELRTQMTGLVAALQGRVPPGQRSEPAQPEPEPDVFENTKGWGDHLVKRATESSREQAAALANQVRVDNSFMIAEAMHGEKFTKAWEACNKLDANNPEDRATVQRILQARNPGKAVIDWHDRVERDRTLGSESLADHDARVVKEAREAMIKDPEIRKQIIESIRSEASGQGGRPARTAVRLPKSLNGASGSGANAQLTDPLAADDSDRAVFDSAWR